MILMVKNLQVTLSDLFYLFFRVNMAYVIRQSIKNSARYYSKQLQILLRNDSTSTATTNVQKDAPGLSPKVVNVPAHEVGPGASKNSTYKNPEYFCYNQDSYFEAEVEMQKFRLPQPSSKKQKS